MKKIIIGYLIGSITSSFITEYLIKKDIYIKLLENKKIIRKY